MANTYDFCVDRTSDAKSESFHVRFKVGDIDPGMEPARLIVSQRYRLADTKSVTVTDFNEATCNCPKDEVQEITVSASLEQIQNLANAVGRGDVPGAALATADIAAGAVVAVVKGAGDAVDKAGEALRKVGDLLDDIF